MKVLGIDPGFDRLGLAVVSGDASRPTLVWSDCVEPPEGMSSERLDRVYHAVLQAIEEFSPDKIAIESLFFSTNKKTAFSVAEARGAILSAVGFKGVPFQEFTPGQIKLAVTGHGGANKEAVASMLPHLLVLPQKKRRDDELDAIAVAITGLANR